MTVRRRDSGSVVVRIRRTTRQAEAAVHAELERIGAQAYEITLDGSRSPETVAKLYISFLHAISSPGFVIFAEHLTVDERKWIHDRLVRILTETSAQFQATHLSRETLRKLGLQRWKAGPLHEIALATQSKPHLEALFLHGDIFFDFVDWIIGEPMHSLPLDVLRTLNLSYPSPSFVARVVKEFKGLVLLRELHGPEILTVGIAADRIERAARTAAHELQVPLSVELNER